MTAALSYDEATTVIGTGFYRSTCCNEYPPVGADNAAYLFPHDRKIETSEPPAMSHHARHASWIIPIHPLRYASQAWLFMANSHTGRQPRNSFDMKNMQLQVTQFAFQEPEWNWRFDAALAPFRTTIQPMSIYFYLQDSHGLRTIS